MFRDGLSASGLKVSPLGGMLFGKDSTPLLDQCVWNELSVRWLLENLLWTPRDGNDQPQRVNYGSLDVEDLGRVHEALLELEPGIASEPMCRLRRAKLEVVVPLAQGEPYRKNKAAANGRDGSGESENAEEEAEGESPGGKKTKAEWIEEIHPDHFYLRVGLGRKASGAYYTPDAFVRFLVQETLEPQVAERSPKDNPNPGAILKLKVLDPAMGSGHFLVGACRFFADKLYEAARLCDELASKAEEQAEKAADEKRKAELLASAAELRKRVEDLPDPNDEIVGYLPSHVPEGEQSGVSQARALAICRRLVAVHCLYGVDKNPLAVELAKVSLWLESYAEGLPLTFLDHRLVCGDSLTGPFLADLMTFPGTGDSIDDLLAMGLKHLFMHINKTAGGAPSGAALDLWQPFAERAIAMLKAKGQSGMVLPSAFHANQSATGIRELYLNQAGLRVCFSFENRNKLFDIHPSFKFATIVAGRAQHPNSDVSCAFYLHDLRWLFNDRAPLKYDRAFIRKTGGSYWSLIELRASADVAVARQCFEAGELFGHRTSTLKIHCGEEMHMAKAAHFFSPIESTLGDAADPRTPGEAKAALAKGFLPLHEGKTFHQFNDRWDAPPRYLVSLDKIAEKQGWLRASRYFRLAFRDIASSTNERTGIFCFLPPGVLCGNTAPCERSPDSRASSSALVLVAVANSYPFDWTLRLKSAAHVNLFILDGCPVPPSAFKSDRARFLAHSALRLSCNHEGFAPLWSEQLDDEWREASPRKEWPVLASESDRWSVRAAIDAVVADAYGLSRDHYEHILGSFSHKSFPEAPKLCLGAFGELKEIGLKAFLKKHDPYWDIPPNPNLPKPVDRLPLPGRKPTARPRPPPGHVRRSRIGPPPKEARIEGEEGD